MHLPLALGHCVLPERAWAKLLCAENTVSLEVSGLRSEGRHGGARQAGCCAALALAHTQARVWVLFREVTNNVTSIRGQRRVGDEVREPSRSLRHCVNGPRTSLMTAVVCGVGMLYVDISTEERQSGHWFPSTCGNSFWEDFKALDGFYYRQSLVGSFLGVI